MPEKVPVSFAASAVTDLENILEHYGKEGVPETGRRTVAEIVAQAERLGSYPLSGRIVPEFNLKHLSEVIHPPFRIVYRSDGKRVRVVRVWRSERLLRLP
jgi:plasmid stabilization system protein ParE